MGDTILSAFEGSIEDAKAALAGDSNDAEHDALVCLTETCERMYAALTEPVKDILGKLRWETAWPPVALYDHEAATSDFQTTNDSQE